MVIFAAATGLRPAEWLALERRDIDLEARVVYVHRSFTKGRLKCPKTEASRRAVPLQTIALDAIERQPSRRQSALVFPGDRGGYLDLHNFRNRVPVHERIPGRGLAGRTFGEAEISGRVLVHECAPRRRSQPRRSAAPRRKRSCEHTGVRRSAAARAP